MEHSLDPSSSPLDRRTVLKGAVTGAAVVGGALAFGKELQDAAAPRLHSLPELPYATDALEPVIGKRIMELHHGMHHKAYVNGLNKALEKHPNLQAQPLDTLLKNLDRLPEDIRGAVRNHGGGHANHSLFWSSMSPKGGGEPQGNLAEAIAATFGDFAKFQAAFEAAGAGVFGSGWVWLVRDADGMLALDTTPNQDTPVTKGKRVLLGNDVWEHAYYLTYENRRGEYLKAWWRVVDWTAVAARFEG